MKTCEGCIREQILIDDDYMCDECSRLYGDRECTCHVNPPCSFCVEDMYEEKEYK